MKLHFISEARGKCIESSNFFLSPNPAFSSAPTQSRIFSLRMARAACSLLAWWNEKPYEQYPPLQLPFVSSEGRCRPCLAGYAEQQDFKADLVCFWGRALSLSRQEASLSL